MMSAKYLEQNLYYAAKWGRFDDVKRIIRSSSAYRRFNINFASEKGNTSLFIVCAWGYKYTYYSTSYAYYEIAKFLIENGADVNIANDKGQTPLFIAAACGHHHIVELLILYGADLNVLANNKLTALQIAAYAQRVPHPEYNSFYTNLSKHHAYWSAKEYIENLMQTREYTTLRPGEIDNDYRMLVHYSATRPTADIPMEIMNIVVKYNHYAVVELLVTSGADVNVPDRRGYTALAKANYCGQNAIAQLLRENGAVYRVPTKQGTTRWTH